MTDPLNLDSLIEYSKSLPVSERFLVEQYTHHGDVIINSVLKGTDTIATYNDEIIRPAYFEPLYQSFYCIFMNEIYINKIYNKLPKELKPTAKDVILTSYYDYKDLKDSVEASKKPTYDNSELREKAEKFTEQYDKVIYMKYIRPVLTPPSLSYLDIHLNYFRKMTYTIIQTLTGIIQRAPRSPHVFTVYRGVKDFYLDKTPGTISKLSWFHSTSLELEFAEAFGRDKKRIYMFKVHPDCNYMYMEPLTLHKGEEEILFTPGNRVVFLSEEIREQTLPSGKVESWTYQTFAILPPESGYTFPKTYEEYSAYLQTIQAEQNVSQENQTSLATVRE
jgi:hypothetical protein